MKAQPLPSLEPLPLQQVVIEDAFWTPRVETNRMVTLPTEYEQCRVTGRIDAWRLDWTPGAPNPPHHFWDSDVAKWIEAAEPRWLPTDPRWRPRRRVIGASPPRSNPMAT